MKLYWKIFLISLALIMVAVGITSFAFLRYSFLNSEKSAEEMALASHAYIVAEFKSKAEYQREKSNSFIISADGMTEALEHAVGKLSAAESGETAAVFIEARVGVKSVCDGVNMDIIDTSVFPVGENSGKYYSCIIENDGKRYLTVYSGITAAGSEADVFSAQDVTGMYEGYEKELKFAALVSVISAVTVSVILFVLTYFLLRPLKNVNTALEMISGGDYDVRLKASGGREFCSISENVNIMVEAVGKNVKKLENIAEGRKQYVDRLAHEMKTPLTSILCFGDLLRIKKNVPEAERIEYAGIIVDEAKRMKNMSSKLLELAVAESAEIELRCVPVMEILTETVSAIGPGFEADGIKLCVNDDAEDGNILCDRELFKSLIYNICDNARKASEKGQTVTLTCRRKNGKMLIFIIDRGIGMTKDVLKKVTKPFYMADKNRSRKEGGAGIGLSLCVEIAKLHGASISAKSHPGKGTTMIISIPEAEEREYE